MEHLSIEEKEEQILRMLRQTLTPIKTKIIADRLNTHERMVRRLVRDLISRGFLIASSMEEPYGYFIPTTEKQKKRYRNQLISRIKHIADRLKDFDQITAHKIQQVLDFDEG